MELSGGVLIAVIAGSVLLFIVMLGLVLSRFYQRAAADEALVRTGSGGPKVVIGGGILCLPVLHQIMKVSLKTVTLTVERQGRQALVTDDKIKACCTMELYIKVDSEESAILKAAQSFGENNVDANILKDIVEGKLTDALRGVAANKKFAELHAKREEFAEAVKEALATELEKNGLKLESTSLTDLSQLPINQMDKNDVHDAVGLRNILVTVSDAQMQSNKIENERDVTIQQQDVEAKQRALALEKQKEMLEADQRREVAEYQAKQTAEQKSAVLAHEQAAEEAALAQQREIQNAQIAQEEAVEARNLERQKLLAQKEAEKNQAEKTAQIQARRAVEAAEIERAKAIEAAQIDKQREIEAAEINKAQSIETAEIAKAVAIAQKDTEKAQAEAALRAAEAQEAAARESIKTAEEKAQAERQKAISIVNAEEAAARDKIDADKNAHVAEVRAQAEFVVAEKRAEAERVEAEGKARALRERAQGEAQQKTIAAEAIKTAALAEAEADALKITTRAKASSEAATLDAEAKKLLAEALLAEGKAEAEAKRLLVEAENAVSDKLLMRDVALKAIETSPAVVEQFVKSVQGLDMKVVQVNGMNKGEGGEGGFMGELGSTPFGLALGTLAQYSALSPALKMLMGEEDGIAQLAGKARDTAKSALDAIANRGSDTPASTTSNRLAAAADDFEVEGAKKVVKPKPRTAKPKA